MLLLAGVSQSQVRAAKPTGPEVLVTDTSTAPVAGLAELSPAEWPLPRGSDYRLKLFGRHAKYTFHASGIAHGNLDVRLFIKA